MKTKILILLLVLLFGLPFTLIGTLFGVWPLVEMVHGWQKSRSWELVPARVLDAKLDTYKGRKSTTYKVTTRYQYEFRGVTYEAERISFPDDEADNIGSWHQDWHAYLKETKDRNRMITVWVDPADPAQATIDRNIRWAKLVFLIPFAVLFPAIGLIGLWAAVKVLRTPSSQLDGRQAPPNLDVITCDGRGKAVGLWLFSTFWNLISFPVAILAFADGGIPWIAGIMVLIFPAIGVFMIHLAIRATRAWWRFGSLKLTLMPAQPTLGAPFSGTIEFSKVEQPTENYQLTLVCDEIKSQGKSQRTTNVWKEEKTAQRIGNSLSFGFDTPAHLPASQAHSSHYHRWQLRIQNADKSLERNFQLSLAKPAIEQAVFSAA